VELDNQSVETLTRISNFREAQIEILPSAKGTQSHKTRKLVCSASVTRERGFTRKTSCKKAAFTLAEVLIAIGIIGVVSALTIPTLMHKYRENVAATKLKKTYAELQQAVKLSEVENGDISGWDFSLGPGDFTEKYIIPYLAHSGPKNLGFRQMYLLGSSRVNRCNWYTYRYLDKTFGVFRESTTDCYEIYMDFNGYTSPNRMGKDIFLFTIYQNGYHRGGCYSGLPLVGSSGSTAGYEKLVDTYSDCFSTGNGFTCSVVIQQNGWKIPKDYPLKF
jgi:prepilin-type N-terminal cleavage/methylation domain-containing protein